ncbi:hypothetical protein MY9_2052 [Bacillus sp. JS]|nr:hypothetical protein MY9_2052 [Bacillus sp. JS]
MKASINIFFKRVPPDIFLLQYIGRIFSDQDRLLQMNL